MKLSEAQIRAIFDQYMQNLPERAYCNILGYCQLRHDCIVEFASDGIGDTVRFAATALEYRDGKWCNVVDLNTTAAAFTTEEAKSNKAVLVLSAVVRNGQYVAQNFF